MSDAEKLHGDQRGRVQAEPDSPAFLQFSSGTTLEPKAVIITHKNLLSNLAMIDSFFEMFTEEEVERGGVCWLPLYHDMGLIGFMFMGLYHPGTVTYIGPDQFHRPKPRMWLETMSRYKAIVSAAPDFAYARVPRRSRTTISRASTCRTGVSLSTAPSRSIRTISGGSPNDSHSGDSGPKR